MTDENVIKCQSCGKKMSRVRSAEASAPKVGYQCSKCNQWVCGDCTDWNASDTANKVCTRCSGRVAPHKCACD